MSVRVLAPSPQITFRWDHRRKCWQITGTFLDAAGGRETCHWQAETCAEIDRVTMTLMCRAAAAVLEALLV